MTEKNRLILIPLIINMFKSDDSALKYIPTKLDNQNQIKKKLKQTKEIGKESVFFEDAICTYQKENNLEISDVLNLIDSIMKN